jgi:hypothetical protein
MADVAALTLCANTPVGECLAAPVRLPKSGRCGRPPGLTTAVLI